MMVSRSETARPLLTQGQIQELPEIDEIVMMAGVKPIRAQKTRYFTEPQVARRILSPPALGPLADD